MNLRFFYLLIILISVTFLSCENQNFQSEKHQNIELISPKGFSLANSTSDLLDKIASNSDINIDKNEVNIQKIKYYETDNSSFGVVNYLTNEGNKSTLFLLNIDENCSIFRDSKNVYVIESKNDSKEITNLKNTIVIDNDSNFRTPLSSITYNCTAEECCGWTNPAPNHMHCGCPNAITMTTSDGCGIEIIENIRVR